MADEFDIIDIVFDAVESASTGLLLYKDNSPTGEKNDHIVFATTGINRLDYVNKAPAVNINIFIKRYDNGMPVRGKMKEIVRKVKASIEKLISPAGMYFKAKIVWSIPLGEAKEGFDCTNIRLEVITEK